MDVNAVISIIRKLIPDDGGLDFQHLRRFAKFLDVPEHVRDDLIASSQHVPRNEGEPPRLLLIVGPVSAVSLEDLTPAISATVNVSILTVKVPLLAPTSQEQAKAWTAQYWPTVYKKSNPFGPHPSIVSRAEEEICNEVQKWMDLAHDVAKEASEARYGGSIGVVVVERKAGKAKTIAVTGDLRWMGCGMVKRGEGAGNVTAHAVMRAIGMVAGALRVRDEEIRNSSEEADSMINDTRGSKSFEGFTFDVSKDPIKSAVWGSRNDDRTHNPDAGAQGRSDEPRKGNPGLALDHKTPVCGVPSPAEVAADSAAMHEEPKVSASDWSAFTPPSGIKDNDIFLDRPLLPLEKEHFDPNGNQNGYLCHDLEIYCTHEPCVMCSMAIVHSRFGKVVFQERMSRTGGMCADGELGHGLAWRKELNWTLLAWQWQIDSGADNCGELNA
jgi:tRNA-specific adenosine deaminase 3